MRKFKVQSSKFKSDGARMAGAASLGILALVSGCKVGPDYSPPAVVTTDQWAHALEGGVKSSQPDLRRWWASLGDPMLESLVDRAVRGNLDLREAQARVLEARGQRRVVAADGLPQVNASASYAHSRGSENVLFAGPGSGQFNNQNRDLHSVGFDANWELDIFGRVSRGVEASEADIAAFEESQRNVMVTLLAEVARNYVEVRSFQQRLSIAQANVRSQAETVSLSRARYEAGLSNELDLKRAESQLATTQSSIPALEAGMRLAAHRLGVLLGSEPGSLLAELAAPGPIPGVPAEVAIGLPAELLRRRPDVRSAERFVAAANARIGVATADLYPRFRLVGSLGLQAMELPDLFEGNSRVFSIGPSVQWALLEWGRIRGNIAVQNARTEQAAARYERTVLLALEEAENAIVNYAREQDRLRSLSEAVVAAERAVELSTELYTRGLADFFSVLDTQRQLFLLQDQLVQSRRTVTANLIAVYKALGGGWEDFLPRAGDPGGPSGGRAEPMN